MGRPPSLPGHTLYDRLRLQILRGALAAGDRLPSTREQAAQLGLARMTVVRVYQRLVEEGYAQPRGGSGTYVAAIAPERLLSVRSRFAVKKARAASPAQRTAPPQLFAPQLPALDLFPRASWARLVGRAARGLHGLDLSYQDAQGLPVLRESIAHHWNATRGARMDPERLVITAGAQNALDLIARSLCRPGDLVAMESPGYPFAQKAFRNAGLEVIGVPVDGHGLVVTALDKLPRAPRLIYLTPGHQQPTGAVLAMPRRLDLLDRARRLGSYVVEDDYDSEFRYAGRPVPVLQSLDTHGRVLLVSSFSKTLCPAVRVGFVHLASDADAAKVVRRQNETQRSLGPLEQRAVALFLQEGLYARHLRSMRREYAARRDNLRALVESPMGRPIREAMAMHWPDTGFCAIGYLREGGRSIDDVKRQASARGIELVSFQARAPSSTAVMLGFGCMPSAEMARAVQLLSECFGAPSELREA